MSNTIQDINNAIDALTILKGKIVHDQNELAQNMSIAISASIFTLKSVLIDFKKIRERAAQGESRDTLRADFDRVWKKCLKEFEHIRIFLS